MAGNNQVLGKTREVLELMRDVEEQISRSTEDFGENQAVCEQMKQTLKELREIRGKCLLEADNASLISQIKDNNQRLLNFAQQVHTCIQEQYSDLNSLETESAINEDLFNNNQEKYSEKLKSFSALLKKIKSKDKELTEESEKITLEGKKIDDENVKLENELNDRIIEDYQNYIVKEAAAMDVEENYEERIKEIENILRAKDNEISEISQSLEEIKRFKEQKEMDWDKKITKLEQQMGDVEIETEEAELVIIDYQQKIDEISKKITFLSDGIKRKEEACSDLQSELNEIDTNLKSVQESVDETINYCKNSIHKMEEAYEGLEKRVTLMKSELSICKNNIETQEEYNKKVQELLLQHDKVDVDLNLEIKQKEETLRELKTGFKQLRDEYDRQVLDFEAQLKRDQADIESGEKTNRKLQDDCDTLVPEINLQKTEQDTLAAEKELQIGKSVALQGRINDVNLKIAEVKAKKAAVPAAYTPKPKRQKRNWDSDTSSEGIDRTLSNAVKQMSKFRKN